MEKYLRIYLITCLFLSSLSIFTIPAVKAQIEDYDSIEKQLQQIQDLITQLNVILDDHGDNLDRLKEDMIQLQANVDNMHSSYLTRDIFDVRMNALESTIDTDLESLDKRLTQTNQYSLASLGIGITLLVFFAGTMLTLWKAKNK